MGTTLATPRLNIGASETLTINGSKRRQRKALSTRKEKNNNGGSEKVHSAFGRLTLIQDCFPTINGKEGKLLCDKVPSCFFKCKPEEKSKESLHSLRTRQPLQPRPAQQPVVLSSFQTTAKETKAFDTGSAKQSLPLISLQSPERFFHQHSACLTLSETLKYIGCFTYIRCRRLEGVKPSLVVSWIRSVDKHLIVSGWQEYAFISQPNMIVLYMLLRDVLRTRDISTVTALRLELMSCLYLCYCYNGHEISYPLKPFLPQSSDSRLPFWDRCMSLINKHSNALLLINRDSNYYAKIEEELRLFGRSLEKKSARP